MTQVFNRPEKGFSMDETNTDGESTLHLCARRGDAQRVELLVASGADLALQNSAGNTPLHVVVIESAREPAMTEAFLEVGVPFMLSFLRCFSKKSFEVLFLTRNTFCETKYLSHCHAI